MKFGARTAEILERAYQGADFSRRRRGSFEALQPLPGDRLLDIGCGNGFLTAELALAIGDEGRIIGVDPSETMRNAAIERCAAFENADFLDGTANQLPIEDASIDKAVSLQVFEYLDDLPGAVAEARRVLVPGGRLVVGDMHWDTLVWFSDDPERMSRVIGVWDRHLVERCVPALLPAILKSGGFELERVQPVTFCDTSLKPDGLANMNIHLIEPFATKRKLLPEDEVRAWVEEQRTLAQEGRFFFSITHFVISARKI